MSGLTERPADIKIRLGSGVFSCDGPQGRVKKLGVFRRFLVRVHRGH
jgi:hypothetical protein